MHKLIFPFLLISFFSIAQKKAITLEDIYKNGTFRGESVAGDFGKTSTDPKLPEELKDENGKLIGKPGDIIYSSV